MNEPIHIAFCADRRVRAGLHVAAYSVVASHDDRNSLLHVHVFSTDLTDDDMALLDVTLQGTQRAYVLEKHDVSDREFARFSSMAGSWGTYLRLLVPRMLPVDRIIYLDVDIVCHLDVSDFLSVDLDDHPAGFVAESTIGSSVDRSLAQQLHQHADKPYFNAGVMVVNPKLWSERRVTERCLEFLAESPALYHEQSALNYVLLDDWAPLDKRFNFISVVRKNWPSLRDEAQLKGKLVHVLDNPKPWDLFAEFVHPHYGLWRSILDKTALRDFRSWHATPIRRFPLTRNVMRRSVWLCYKRALRERLRFNGYSRGW